MRLFPVRVYRTTADTVGMRACLIQAEHGVVRVWRAEPGRQPAVMHEAAGTLTPGAAQGVWSIVWADGEPWDVRAEGGCGCSHPLKNFTPEPIAVNA